MAGQEERLQILPSRDDDEMPKQHTHGWRSRILPVSVGIVGFVAAVVCVAPRAQTMSSGTPLEVVGLAEEAPENLKCKVPKDFCNTNPGREDTLMYRDCDGDGILDPYCEGGQLLRFGYLSSKDGCKNNWPNGICTHGSGPKHDVAMGNGKAAGNEITVIHFNDVYEVAGVLEGGVRRGGMSRAMHVINEERKRNPDRTFAVFAGDLLSPSALSGLFEGAQMVDILNYLQLDAASLGNHEFDFGVDTLKKRIEESKFPWLNINLFDEKGNLLPGTQKRLIRDVPFTPMWGNEEKQARVCLFGSAYDVRETMLKDKHRVKHSDAINASVEEAKFLKENKKCDVVLALSHQFSREDCILSKAMGEKVDLILGGHDHSTELNTVCGNAPYAKSDSDLKTQWIMTLWLDENGHVNSVDGRIISLTDRDPFDTGLHDKVVDWENKGEEEMGKIIGCSSQDMDAVATHVRQSETGLGDFFTDAVRSFHETDVAMINGGTIRGNKVFDKGDLSKKTVTEMHPFGNTIVKVYMKGSELKHYIEKQLECWKDSCGNFVQISGLKYTFNPNKPKGERLVELTHLDSKPVKDNESFTVALSNFMLGNSPYKHNKLYNMVTMNDAVPIVDALFAAVKKAGSKCINPAKDGRLKNAAEA